MWKKLAMLIIASGAAVKVWRMWQDSQSTSHAQNSNVDHATSVQRWEEEGGTPTVPKSAARPDDDADGVTDESDAGGANGRRRGRKSSASRSTANETR